MNLGKATLLAGLVMTLIVGCSDDEPPDVGRQVEYTPPNRPALSQIGLPTDDQGRPVLISGAGLGLVVDETRKNPVSATGRCVDWVIGCFEPTARSLDDCFFSVPRCQTAEPWNESAACCPEACYLQYARERQDRAADPYPSFEKVMFTDGDCMPGLRAALGRSVP